MSEIPGLPGEGSEKDDYLGVASRFGLTERDIENQEKLERERTEREQLAIEREVLSRTTHPEAVRWAFRSFAEKMESVITEAPSLEDRYAAFSLYWIAVNRAQALELGKQERRRLSEFIRLREDGIAGIDVVPLIQQQLIRIPENTPQDVKIIINQRNEEIEQSNKENQLKHVAGEERREPLVKELHRAADEFSARHKLNFQYERYEATGGSVDKYADGFTIPRSYHLQPEDFEAIFSAPPTLYEEGGNITRELLDENPEEGVHFGDSVDDAMRAYYVVSLSERPEELKKLRETPGWRMIFRTNGEEYEWIGVIDEWETKRIQDDDPGYDTLKKEQNQTVSIGGRNIPVRGRLTRWGNLFARYEDAEDRELLRQEMVNFVGGSAEPNKRIGSAAAAERLAFRNYRLMAIAAEGGADEYYEIEKDDKSGDKKFDRARNPILKNKPSIRLEGFPEGSDDLTKLTLTQIWQRKQTASHHAAGPLETREKYSRLLVNFLKFASYPKVEEDETTKRSIWEQWWGYQADPAKGLPAEPALRLREIKWNKLPKDVWRQYMLRVFLAGREDGLLTKITKVAWQLGELANTEFWEKVNTDVNVIINPALITDGKYRGKNKKDIDDEVKKVKKEFKENLVQGIKTSKENGQLLNVWSLIAQYQKLAGY